MRDREKWGRNRDSSDCNRVGRGGGRVVVIEKNACIY